MKGLYTDNVYYFQHEDQSFLDFIRKNEGYVFNDFGGSQVQYQKLHHYDCAYLHNLGRGSLRTSVRKVCSSSKEDLINWLNEKRGKINIGYTECPCMKDPNYKIVEIDTL